MTQLTIVKNSPIGFWEEIIEYNKNIKTAISDCNKNTFYTKRENKKNILKICEEKSLEKVYHDIQNILQKNIKNNKNEKINFSDCIYLIAHKLINNQSYQDLSDDLFSLGNKSITKNTISNKLNKLNSTSLFTINNELIAYIKNNFSPLHNINLKIKSIDGSDVQANIELKNFGYDATKTENYTTPYLSFMTDYNYELIENITVSNKYNERRDANQLIDELKEKQNLILEDAGYFSHNHANKIHKSGNYFIIRLPSDGKLINSIKHKLKNSNVVIYYSCNNNYKIHQYTINSIKDNSSKIYHVITNKIDLTTEEIKFYYNFRWDVEVKINTFKNKIGGKFYNTKKESGLLNTIQIQHFVFLISYIFSRLAETILGNTYNINNKINIDKNKKDNIAVIKKDFHKINIKSSIRISVNSILPSLIYKKYNKEELFRCIERIHNTQTLSILGRHFIHKPTKDNITNKTKERYKIYTKTNVKALYDVEIYKNLKTVQNNNNNTNLVDKIVIYFD